MPILFLGGDQRAVEAARWLTEHRVPACVYGFDPAKLPSNVQYTSDLNRLLGGARAVVLPVPGPDAEGLVVPRVGAPIQVGATVLALLRPMTPVITGWAGAYLPSSAREAGVPVYELMARDDFALYNAIPTSEGAILAAMQHSDITLAQSNCHVVGYGRCGKVQAEHLRGLKANVTIVSRTLSSRAEAEALGYRTCELSSWENKIDEADFVFNTVPAMVLPRRLLEKTGPGVVILDVASRPGGVDFDAAHELARTALLLPALPGRRAPKSAGIYLARTVLAVLGEHENPELGGRHR